jgi:endo-1,4-beta-D-glucanase Y
MPVSRRMLLAQATIAGTLSLGLVLGSAWSPPASAATAAYSCASSMAPDQAAANTELQNSYNTWKSNYVTSSGAGGYLRVKRPENSNDTVSEGIGYGMVLAAYLNDRPTFDGLWSYAKSHFNANGLMHWRIDANNNVTGTGAATDAEEDMALALIVADKKWGGYTTEAKNLINRMMQYEVEAGSYVLKPGDQWGGSSVTNPSYFAPGYYKVFKAYTGDARWDSVVNRSYQIIANVNAKTGAGTTGLQPDWTTAAGDPAPNMGYNYTYDATRVPWRLAKDAAWYCDSRATAQLNKINAFFKGIGAANIKDGYRLDGTLIGQWHNAAFVAPAASGAIISSDTAYKTAMWNETVRLTSGNYYNDNLRLLALLFMSGNMYNPVANAAPSPSPSPSPLPSPSPTPNPSPQPGGLKVQYRAGDTNAGDNQIKPHLQLVNTGSSSIPLSELKIRYWYTVDGDKPQSYWCDWAALGCASVSGRFVKLATPKASADYYLELGFSGGTLAPGASSGEIQSRIAKSDWSNYSESGDYSFDPTKTAFADWSRVTLYRNGSLVWGSEP